MPTCKDCLHVKVCQKTRIMYPAHNYALKCNDFKDCSRFVELPCKIGEKIYDPVRGQISEYKVISFGVNEYGLYLNLRCIQGLYRHSMIRPEWIGTTVFFTPEEAEQALKERESGA